MKTIGVVACLLLGTLGWAQSPAVVRAQQQAGSESTIQGCVLGSMVRSQFILTDETTGRTYLLQGNDPELKAQVGHEVAMTGMASPIPNQAKGGIGYHNPSAPTAGATRLAGRGAATNFTVTDIERLANQCGRHAQNQRKVIAASEAALGSVNTDDRSALEPQIGYAAQSQSENVLLGCVNGSGNDFVLFEPQRRRMYFLKGGGAQLGSTVGRLVQVTGRLVPGTGAQQTHPVFDVERMQVIADCGYQMPPGAEPPQAAGRTGNKGDSFPVADTSTVGAVTPGNETQLGRIQEPGRHTGLAAGGLPQMQNQTVANGVPPTAEETAQNPVAAMEYSEAAEQSELNNPQKQLGVNARPSYKGVRRQQEAMECQKGGVQQQQAAAQAAAQAAQEGETYSASGAGRKRASTAPRRAAPDYGASARR
jgi:hypothetical protein